MECRSIYSRSVNVYTAPETDAPGVVPGKHHVRTVIGSSAPKESHISIRCGLDPCLHCPRRCNRKVARISQTYSLTTAMHKMSRSINLSGNRGGTVN